MSLECFEAYIEMLLYSLFCNPDNLIMITNKDGIIPYYPTCIDKKIPFDHFVIYNRSNSCFVSFFLVFLVLYKFAI